MSTIDFFFFLQKMSTIDLASIQDDILDVQAAHIWRPMVQLEPNYFLELILIWMSEF